MRKRWTPREEVTEDLLIARERQKWQIALRRYLIERKRSPAYAPYFGLDIETYRQWIEIQFEADLNWNNFSSAWQLDYVIPLSYFDFTDPEERKLPCNFINVRVERVKAGKTAARMVDLLTAKRYFEQLLKETAYPVCRMMIEKIEDIGELPDRDMRKLENFIQQRVGFLAEIADFSIYQFEQLNLGMAPEEIIKEQKLLTKMQSK